MAIDGAKILRFIDGRIRNLLWSDKYWLQIEKYVDNEDGVIVEDGVAASFCHCGTAKEL